MPGKVFALFDHPEVSETRVSKRTGGGVHVDTFAHNRSGIVWDKDKAVLNGRSDRGKA
jgi:hypothetical protein